MPLSTPFTRNSPEPPMRALTNAISDALCGLFIAAVIVALAVGVAMGTGMWDMFRALLDLISLGK